MKQSEYINIGKEHFTKVILPRIKEISPNVVENLLVFIEGSVAYGYCDENSDIDIDYYIDIDTTEEIKNQIVDVFFGETYWNGNVRVSYEFGGEYWKIDHVLNNDMVKFWKEFNPYAVNNLAQAIPIWDPKKLLTKIKEKVGFYPEEMKKSVIRGLWITINDSGEYNFEEAIKRNNYCEANIFLYRSLEAMLRLTFILNDMYYPPTKWLSTGIKQLNQDFGVLNLIGIMENNHNLEDIYVQFLKVYEIMKQYLIQHNCIERECIENYPCNFRKPFYIFNSF